MTEEGIKQVDNPEISAGFHAEVQDGAVKQKEFATLAQRLMKRAHKNTFFVDIDDDLQIEIHVPTDGEYMLLLRLQNDMLKTGVKLQREGVKDIDQATFAIDSLTEGWDRLHELLASLCVDPSLDFEFFQSGMISAADKEKIVSGIIKQVKGEQDKIEKFREE